MRRRMGRCGDGDHSDAGYGDYDGCDTGGGFGSCDG